MSTRKILFAAALIAGLVGCAAPPQKPIDMAPDAVTPQAGRIGVVLAQLPKVDTEFPGADCLLCIGAASLANGKLTKHVQTLSAEDMSKVRDELVTRLASKGAAAVALDLVLEVDKLPDAAGKAENAPKKDFTSLRSKAGVDKLLIVEIRALGVWRNYSAYIPTSDPRAVVKGAGYLVNLSKNSYEWYKPIDITKAAAGAWDEPPDFPGLTNAYFEAIEMTKEELAKPLH
jgi:hypothetical protein